VSLREMAKDPGATIDTIAAALDRMSPEERRAEAGSLGRDEQRLLYRKAEGAAPASLDDFVPPARGSLVEVIHHGRNTLPLPGKHRFFQKRFCRPDDDSARLFGYNEAPSRWMVGPGYFVAVPTAGKPEWEERGAVVIDYYQMPDRAVAPGWPAVVPNSEGLQRFVYKGTRDYMRRVSAHVTIGAAFKGEKALDHYFILCREG
jgi:hypothetical protein